MPTVKALFFTTLAVCSLVVVFLKVPDIHSQYKISSPSMHSLVLNQAHSFTITRNGTELIAVSKDEHVREALLLGEKHHLNAVPVVTSKETPYVVGFVDSFDLVHFVMDKYTDEFRYGEIGPHTREHWKNVTRQFKDTGIMEVMNYSKRNPLHVVKQNVSLQEFIELEARQAAITDENDLLIGTLTQANIIEYIASIQSMEELKGLKNPLGLKDYITHEVVTVHDSEKVWKVFQKMVEHGVTSVAVLNDDGTLYDTISATDIKIVNHELMDVFLRTARVFIELRKKEHRPKIVIYCTLSNSTMEVMELMIRQKVHRVFVVKENMIPYGIISMTDVLKEVLVTTIPPIE